MKNVKHLCLAFISFCLLFSCDREARQDQATSLDELAVSERGSKGPKDLPFRATFYTELNEALIAEGEKVCTGNFPFPNIQTGDGTATHLGRFTTRLDFCVLPIFEPTPEEQEEGLFAKYTDLEGCFVAANGDKLFIGLPEVGRIRFTDEAGYDLEFTDVFTIEGGTGRFEGASGQMMSESYVHLETDITDHVWTGTISFDR